MTRMMSNVAQFFTQGPGSMYPFRQTATDDLTRIIREVENGLPNEHNPRIDDAIRNLNFYESRTKQYIRYRDAESAWDHDQKPARLTNLTRQCVNTLCKHLYAPGPIRRVGASSAVDQWYQGICTRNHINAKFKRADRLSTLNDVAMFQVAAAGTQDFISPMRSNVYGQAPLVIHVRGSHEFAAWTDPADPVTPWCVCVITVEDETKRFEVWTADKIYVYRTKKLTDKQTSGGRVAFFVQEESGDNPYKVLPFTFFHYELPVDKFWTSSPGSEIVATNEQINMDLSDIANSVSIYRNPMWLAYNVRSDWKPVNRPGGITHVPGQPNQTQTGLDPRIEPKQSQIDITGSWEDVNNTLSLLYEQIGVPESEVRMKQNASASGVALLSEQIPLLKRTEERRPMAAVYEDNLCRVCCAVSGNYYKIKELQRVMLDPRFMATWPEEEIPIGPDRDQSDEWNVAQGYASQVSVMMKRRGSSREEAMSELEQVMKDKKWYDDLQKKYGLDQASKMAEMSQASEQSQLSSSDETPEPQNNEITDNETTQEGDTQSEETSS